MALTQAQINAFLANSDASQYNLITPLNGGAGGSFLENLMSTVDTSGTGTTYTTSGGNFAGNADVVPQDPFYNYFAGLASQYAPTGNAPWTYNETPVGSGPAGVYTFSDGATMNANTGVFTLANGALANSAQQAQYLSELQTPTRVTSSQGVNFNAIPYGEANIAAANAGTGLQPTYNSATDTVSIDPQILNDVALWNKANPQYTGDPTQAAALSAQGQAYQQTTDAGYNNQLQTEIAGMKSPGPGIFGDAIMAIVIAGTALVTGGIAGGLLGAGAAGFAGGAATVGAGAIGGAAAGAEQAQLTGGDPLKGAEMGGATGALGSAGSVLTSAAGASGTLAKAGAGIATSAATGAGLSALSGGNALTGAEMGAATGVAGAASSGISGYFSGLFGSTTPDINPGVGSTNSPSTQTTQTSNNSLFTVPTSQNNFGLNTSTSTGASSMSDILSSIGDFFSGTPSAEYGSPIGPTQPTSSAEYSSPIGPTQPFQGLSGSTTPSSPSPTSSGFGLGNIAGAAGSFLSPSLLGLGANALSSYFASANQAGAANNATSAQQQMFGLTQQNLLPFIQQGQGAAGALAAGTGLNTANPLTSPLLQAPTANLSEAALEQTPGYQFNLYQGLKGVQNSYASQGLGSSGAAIKGAAQYATGLADSTYQNQYNNAVTNQTNQFNRLMSLSGLGESAAAGQGTIGAQTASNIGNNIIGAANAGSAAINSAGNAASNYALTSPYYNALTNAITQNTQNSQTQPGTTA